MKIRHFAFVLVAPIALAACGDSTTENSTDTNLTIVDDLNTTDPLSNDSLLLNDTAFDEGTNFGDPLNEVAPLDNASNRF